MLLRRAPRRLWLRQLNLNVHHLPEASQPLGNPPVPNQYRSLWFHDRTIMNSSRVKTSIPLSDSRRANQVPRSMLTVSSQNNYPERKASSRDANRDEVTGYQFSQSDPPSCSRENHAQCPKAVRNRRLVARKRRCGYKPRSPDEA